MLGMRRWSSVDDIFDFQRHIETVFDQFWNELPRRTAMGGSPSFQVTTTAALLAKRAVLRPLTVGQPRPDLRELEAALLDRVNALGIGPQGLGGIVTALAVHIEVFPTHIAGMPVAVNLGCHSMRGMTAEL